MVWPLWRAKEVYHPLNETGVPLQRRDPAAGRAGSSDQGTGHVAVSYHAGCLDLIDAKNELVKVGNDLLGRWRDWRSGKEWRSRTDRIEAARAILVATAFFEALEATELAFAPHELELGRHEREHVAELVSPVYHRCTSRGATRTAPAQEIP